MKKILLTLGTTAAAIVPVMTMVSCSIAGFDVKDVKLNDAKTEIEVSITASDTELAKLTTEEKYKELVSQTVKTLISKIDGLKGTDAENAKVLTIKIDKKLEWNSTDKKVVSADGITTGISLGDEGLKSFLALDEAKKTTFLEGLVKKA